MSKKITTLALLAGAIASCALCANLWATEVAASVEGAKQGAAFNATPAARAAHVAGVNAQRLKFTHRTATADANTPGPKVQGTDDGGTLFTGNLVRAYPPSCLASPLPDSPTGQTWLFTNFPLDSLNSQTGEYATENVTITIWRIPCSSSGATTSYNTDGGYNAITLMRIDRDSSHEGDTTTYPLYPDLRIAQGSIAFDDPNHLDYVRSATEPNTLVADTLFETPVPYSQTFVLENYPYADSGLFFFNYQFDIRVTTTSSATNSLTVSDYSPNQTDYPAAYEPLLINGYSTASWAATDDPLDGLFVTVSESLPDASGNVTRQLIFTRLFADQFGRPFFIVGNAAFNYGDRTLTVNASYLGAGTHSSYAVSPWGTATFTFNNCNDLEVDYAPENSGLPGGVPGIAETVGYQRINLANGLLCE